MTTPRVHPSVDDHPNLGPHTKCERDHGGVNVPEHCRRGCKWPCPDASRPGVFTLRWPAMCDECETNMPRGTLARYEGDLLVHDECPAFAPTAASAVLCPRCGLLHPGEC